MFKFGNIEGVIVREIKKYVDERGFLAEVFRKDVIFDEIGIPEIMPEMGYVSLTYPGVVRGPHEHLNQYDFFCFIGPSNFKIYLWDRRENSKTYLNRMILFAGEDSPKIVIIPPGVVHAYKNVGDKAGLTLNFPNKLYAGWGKKEKVDEIRYENIESSPFKID